MTLENKNKVKEKIPNSNTSVTTGKETKLGQYSPRILIRKFLINEAINKKPLIRTP